MLPGTEPGRVAIVGNGVGGPTLATHLPGGTTWDPAQTLPIGESVGSIGAGGLVARTTPGLLDQTVEVFRGGSDGMFTSLGAPTIGPDDAVADLGAAPDGSAVVAIVTQTERLRVLVRSTDGTWTARTPAGSATVDDASVALGPTGILTVAWVASTVDAVASSVAAATYGPGQTGAPIVLESLVDPSGLRQREVDELVASPSRTGEPGAVWIDIDDLSNARIRGGNAGAIGSFAEASDEAIGSDIRIAGSATRAVVTWTDSGTGTATFASIDRSCTLPSDLVGPAVTVRGGTLVAVGLRAGRLAVGEIDGACAVGVDPAPTPGPPIAGTAEFEAAADAEGTLVVAARDDGSGAISVAVDDRAAPRIEQVRVPADVEVGVGISTAAAVADTWGPATLRWTIGGGDAGTGPTASGSFSTPGVGLVELAAQDAVGNLAVERRSVTVNAAVRAPEPPPSPAPNPDPPPGPDPGTPVGPPVVVPVPEPDPRPTAKRPQARITSVQERPKGWFMGVRVRHADRLEVGLYRERYKRSTELGRKAPRCAPRPRPARRPAAGRRAQLVVQTGKDRVSVPLSKSMTLALRKRGRYSLTVVARSGKSARSVPAVKRFTVCR